MPARKRLAGLAARGIKGHSLCPFLRSLRGVGPSGPGAESYPPAAESLLARMFHESPTAMRTATEIGKGKSRKGGFGVTFSGLGTPNGYVSLERTTVHKLAASAVPGVGGAALRACIRSRQSGTCSTIGPLHLY